MLVGELVSRAAIFAFGEGGEFLSRNESIGVIIGIVVILMAIAASLLYRRTRAKRDPYIESCMECGSMNVNHRAGLAVCMDCGYSVRLAEVTAD